jgi:hypothetical protein
MKKLDWPAGRAKVQAADKAVLREALEGVDGHTLYSPQKFLEAGLDAEIVAAFTKVHRSAAGHGKETLYTDGGRVDSLKGVYGLELLEFVAGCFGVDSWKMGRGFRAAHLLQQLLAGPLAPGKED